MFYKATYRLVKRNEKSVSSLFCSHAAISAVFCICLVRDPAFTSKRAMASPSPSTSDNHGFGIHTAGSEFSFSGGWTIYCHSTPPSKSVHGRTT